MQRNSLKFDPTIAKLAMPSSENGWTALGKGLKEVGATVNMARDRSRKEDFEDKAESRASEKHGWDGEKHRQSMTKGQLDIDYKRQSNPKLLKGLDLANSRSEQIIAQSDELHPLKMQGSWLDNKAKDQKITIDLGSYLSGEKAKAQTYDINAAKEATRKEFVPLEKQLAQKKVTEYGKPKKTTAQSDFEYGVKNPEFAKMQEEKRKSVAKTTSKEDSLFKKTLIRDARKIKDPKKRAEAYAIIRNGGDLSEISDKVAAIASDVSLTLDHKKAKEKNAIKIAEAQSTFEVFDRLIENYDKDYIGPYDNRKASVTGMFDATTNPKQQAYKTDLGRLTLVAKKLENMGASFTKSEQEMMQRAMPNPDMSESTYKAQLATYIRTMRDFAKNKLSALDSANYDTGKLNSFIEKMDETVAKAERFAGLKTQQQPSQPKKQSLYKKQTTQKTVVRTGMHNGRKVVQYSDGSTEYVK
jgi:hypothetical protein